MTVMSSTVVLSLLLFLQNAPNTNDDLDRKIQILEQEQSDLRGRLQINEQRIGALRRQADTLEEIRHKSGDVLETTVKGWAFVYDKPSETGSDHRIGDIKGAGVKVAVLDSYREFFKVMKDGLVGWVLRTNLVETAAMQTMRTGALERNRLADLREEETARVAALLAETQEEKAQKIAKQAAAKRRSEAIRMRAEAANRLAEERAQSLKARFGAEVGSRLSRREFWIGMSKAMAVESLGRPNSVNRTVTAARVHEQWVYGGSVYLYFEGDTLTSFQD